MSSRSCTTLFVALLSVAFAAAEEPFVVTATTKDDGGRQMLTVAFKIADGHHLYADKTSVTIIEPSSAVLKPLKIPAPEQKKDAFSDEVVGVYAGEVSFLHEVVPASAGSITIEVEYQGCSEEMCFLPARERLIAGPFTGGSVKATVASVEPRKGPAPSGGWQAAAERFYVAGTATGFMGPAKFLDFISKSESGQGSAGDSLRSVFESKGVILGAILILLSGLALNLTPCVLPMIPINLAIIGAGSQGNSRSRGFVLGGVYGLGMALAYGAVGMSVILTGARVGSLNASPWFNAGIAVVFAIMALAMLGVFNVDLSRFRSGKRTAGQRRGGMLTALIMGAISALLAGACVAPAVLSVLLLSMDLYSKGSTFGLVYPFLLGAGMALPWPFAGAGLSFLPKPGQWMEKVKLGFGILIIGFAGWYGWESAVLFHGRSAAVRSAVASTQDSRTKEGWLTSLDEALAAAERENKPVFVDFWASWCKNCLAMDRLTFSDKSVGEKLSGFIRVKVRAEDLREPQVKEMMDYYCIYGLPTYLVLKPGDPPAGMERTPCKERGGGPKTGGTR